MMKEILVFLAEPIFWYVVAFTLFMVLFFAKIRKPILGVLDAEIAKVRVELEHAQRLRTEAEAVLNDYLKKKLELEQQAEAILAHAREEAARLRASAEDTKVKALKRREEQALERIRLAEVEAVDAIRTAIVAQALAAARKEFEAQGDAASASRLVDAAMAEVPDLLVKAVKARAA